MTPAVVPSSTPTATPLSTAADVADAFDVLAAAANWLEADEALSLLDAPNDLAQAARQAEQARASLARVDPDLLLSGVAAWVVRHGDRMDLGAVTTQMARAEDLSQQDLAAGRP